MDYERATARCWAEIDLDIVAANYRSARRICGDKVEIIPVLKANAYGLGEATLSRLLADLGARLFAVAEPGEAFAIKRACGRDALVLGMTAPCLMEEAVHGGLVLTIYSPAQAREIDAAAKRMGVPARVHIKLDTGLHRLGFDPGDMDSIRCVFALENLRVEGLYTHLALREDAADAIQIARLQNVAEVLKSEGFDYGILHACDSIGMVRHPDYRFDAVRIGAWLYGVVPTRYPNTNGACRLPVRLMTRVTQVRRVAKGEYLGYDEEHPLIEDRTIATLCAGYADGYPRVNSAGMVWVRGKMAPVAGLVCMDQMTVDVTDIPDVRPGDAVTLLGDGISLNALSDWSHVHRNDILSRMGRRVPRVYLRGGEMESIIDYTYD